MFKNASRRYWTRKEATTDLVSGQMSYTFPEDMVRITTVKVTTGALTLSVQMIDSEEQWNRLTLIPAMTVGIPTTGFIRGRNELQLYPVPSVTTIDGLIVSYECRERDMSLDDTTPSINVTFDSVAVTASTSVFNANMKDMSLQVTDGSDGNWYPIVGYTSPTQITLENVYQGLSKSGVASLIGSVPDIPEDYHLALVYYACYNYFLKRKDTATAGEYNAMYMGLLQQYENAYASKSTGQTLSGDILDSQYNLFGLPPYNLTA